MLAVIVFHDTARIRIVGDPLEFKSDLAPVRSIPGKDRRWDPERQAWVVKNINNYLEISAVLTALEERKLQLKFALGK